MPPAIAPQARLIAICNVLMSACNLANFAVLRSQDITWRPIDGFQRLYSRYEFVLEPVTPVSIGETFEPSHVVATLITGRVIEVAVLRERLPLLVTVCSVSSS